RRLRRSPHLPVDPPRLGAGERRLRPREEAVPARGALESRVSSEAHEPQERPRPDEGLADHVELWTPAGLRGPDPVAIALSPVFVDEERDATDLELAEALLVRPVGEERHAGNRPDDLPERASIEEERRHLEGLHPSILVPDVVDLHRVKCAVVFSSN